MATTQKGIYYNNDYDVAADILEDERLMAESVDEVIGDVETNIEEELANKVDKVQGKDLSTNDYDNTEKRKVQANTEARHTHSNKSVLDGTTASYTTEKDQKLDGLENYDDTELREDIEQNRTSIEENYKVITKLQEENEDLKKNQLTNTPEIATSHYLQDSADSRFRKFIPIGRTTQESTTGNQLIPFTNQDFTVNNVRYYVQNGYLYMNGTSTSETLIINSNFKNNFSFTLPAGTYYVNRNSLLIPFAIKKKSDDTTIINNVGTFTLNEDTELYLGFYIYQKTFNNDLITTQVNPGSIAQPLEPYTGGEPAPNPKYPFPIKNTGDNGSVNEKVQTKNFLTNLEASANTTVTNGVVTQTSADTRSDLQWKIQTYNGTTKVEELPIIIKNTKGIFSRTFTKNSTFNRIRFGLNGSQKDTLVISDVSDLPDGEYKLVYNITNVTQGSISWKDIMITKATETDLTYVLHSEQNISFPLAQGQKFYEGSYPDDDEKLHHVRGKVVLIDEYISSLITLNNGNKALTIKLPNKKRTTGNYLLCNKAINNLSFSDGTFYENNTNIVLIGNENDNLETLKEKYNGAVFEYILAEEQTEDFTEEQKTAWKEWKKARTYKNVTHISSEDETPANLEVEYVQDTKTYIDNKVTALTNAIISLGGNI